MRRRLLNLLTALSLLLRVVVVLWAWSYVERELVRHSHWRVVPSSGGSTVVEGYGEVQSGAGCSPSMVRQPDGVH